MNISGKVKKENDHGHFSPVSVNGTANIYLTVLNPMIVQHFH